MTKEQIIKQLLDMAKHPTVTLPRDCEALKIAADLLAQPEQEPNHVATVAEVHMSRYTIEWTNGPLPEGAKLYDAPQRKPLTDEHPLMVFAKECVLGAYQETELADAAQRAIKAAHGIKE